MWCPLRFPRKSCSILLDFHLFCIRVDVPLMLFVFIYAYWRPTRFPHQMMSMSFISNTTGVTYGARTADPSGAPMFTPDFWWDLICSIFSFLCNIWRSLLVLLSFLFWPLCCLSSFDWRLLITALASSNFTFVGNKKSSNNWNHQKQLIKI